MARKTSRRCKPHVAWLVRWNLKDCPRDLPIDMFRTIPGLVLEDDTAFTTLDGNVLVHRHHNRLYHGYFLHVPANWIVPDALRYTAQHDPGYTTSGTTCIYMFDCIKAARRAIRLLFALNRDKL